MQYVRADSWKHLRKGNISLGEHAQPFLQRKLWAFGCIHTIGMTSRGHTGDGIKGIICTSTQSSIDGLWKGGKDFHSKTGCSTVGKQSYTTLGSARVMALQILLPGQVKRKSSGRCTRKEFRPTRSRLPPPAITCITFYCFPRLLLIPKWLSRALSRCVLLRFAPAQP